MHEESMCRNLFWGKGSYPIKLEIWIKGATGRTSFCEGLKLRGDRLEDC